MLGGLLRGWWCSSRSAAGRVAAATTCSRSACWSSCLLLVRLVLMGGWLVGPVVDRPQPGRHGQLDGRAAAGSRSPGRAPSPRQRGQPPPRDLNFFSVGLTFRSGLLLLLLGGALVTGMRGEAPLGLLWLYLALGLGVAPAGSRKRRPMHRASASCSHPGACCRPWRRSAVRSG